MTNWNLAGGPLKKKKIFTLTLVLMMAIFFGACGNDSISRMSTDSNLPLLELEEISEWPENKYTAAIVQPEVGTPYMATVYDETAGYFSVSLNNATRAQSEEYIELLKENGFETVFSKSEDVSIGVLLQKENVGVSIATSENEFGIYIRLYED